MKKGSIVTGIVILLLLTGGFLPGIYAMEHVRTHYFPIATKDGSNAEIKWKLDLKTQPSDAPIKVSNPIVGKDGTVYICANSTFYAIAPDGNVKWKLTETGTWGTPTIGNDGNIYVLQVSPSGNVTLYAINADGKFKWKFPLGCFGHFGTPTTLTPAISSDDTIYVEGYSSLTGTTLDAINSNGTLKWKIALHSGGEEMPIFQIQVAKDGTIYVAIPEGSDTELAAVSHGGKLRWKISLGMGGDITIGKDGSIYATRLEFPLAYIFLLNPTNGSLKKITWINVRGSLRMLVANDGTIYVANGNFTEALNPNGKEKWHFVDKTNSYQSSLVQGESNTLYFITENHLYALTTQGSEKWELRINASSGNLPAVSSDGTVYIVGFDSNHTYVYAVQEKSSGSSDQASYGEFGWSTLLWIIASLIVVIGIAVAVVILKRNRKGEDKEETETAGEDKNSP